MLAAEPRLTTPSFPSYSDAPPESGRYIGNHVYNLPHDELRDTGRAFNFPNAHFGDLDNDIHPIFSSLVTKAYLHPALKLASKYLDDPLILPFWHALIFSDVTSEPHGAQHSAGPLSTLRASNSAQQLIPSTSAAAPRAKPSPYAALALGRALSESITRQALLEFFTETRVRASFALAVTLLHEITHAIWFCSHLIQPDGEVRNLCMGPWDRDDAGIERVLNKIEPFLDEQPQSELGFALEIYLFGGLIDFYRYPAREDMHCILHWQKWSESRVFLALEVPGCERPVLTCRGRPKIWLTEYVIAMDWVQKQFRKSFWKEEVREKGLGALQIEKVLGMSRSNPVWEGGSDDDDDDDDDDEDDTTKVGKTMDEQGVVRPGQCDSGLFERGREVHPFKEGMKRKFNNMDDAVRKKDLKALNDSSRKKSWWRI